MYKIIGITGAFGSGKSTASDFFVPKGFTKIILSSFLEEEADKRGIRKVTRKILQDIGNEWRKKHGADILAKKALALLEEKKIKKAVIDGIRNPKEIEAFRKNRNFTLVAIIVDKELRFKRLKNSKRRERLTWKLFERLDRRDLGLGQRKTGLHVTQCISLADFFIENNQTLIELEEKLGKKLSEINL